MRTFHVVAAASCFGLLAGASHAQSWAVTGNLGLNGTTNFIGTTDAVPLVFRSNNQQVMSLFNQLTTVNTDQFDGSNLLAGWNANTIAPGATASTVFGGVTLNATAFGNHAYDIGSTISGGVDNVAGTDDGFLFGQPYATVAGGVGNTAAGDSSSVLGGINNQATGAAATVAGGENNIAGGDWSFAAGTNAVVRTAATVGDSNGDQGTFIWSDASSVSAFTSTNANQFLVRAANGMGVGTNNPRSQLEVSAAGTFQRTHLRINETTGSFSRLAFTNSTTNKFWHFSAKCDGATSADDQLNYYYQDASGVGRNPLQIRGDGRIAIGGPPPGTGVTLDVFGTTRCTTLIQTSSQRYKTGVEPVGGVLDRFLRLRPVTFTWDSSHGGTKDLGLIAEEVAQVFPEAVATIDGQVEGINYSRVTALAIQAVKEQQAEVDTLKAENADLKARLERIEKLLSDRR